MSLVSGIAHFQGAIANSTSGPLGVAFQLPAGLAPTKDVYVPVDLCGATKGRLFIEHVSGNVSVQAEGGALNNAKCFTSLEGASFAPSANGFAPLVPLNNWANAPFNTSDAAVESLNGIVHFKGAIANSTSGANSVVFILPVGFRPTTDVYVPVDLCNATNGRLWIQPNGTVTVQGSLSNATCFTSLDGAWFAQDTSSFMALVPWNGWFGKPFDTNTPAIEDIGGILYFSGAIATSTQNMVPFTLPPQFWPAADVYVPVDLCSATNGRLWIRASDGVVTVQPQGGNLPNAECFTSLDGVSYTFIDITLPIFNYYACQPPCELNLRIPDGDPEGVVSVIDVTPAGVDIQGVTVDVDITHPSVGDLVIQVIAPSGEIATLSNRAGGSERDFVATGLDISASFTRGSSASGAWQLFVRDLVAGNVGTINSFALHITSDPVAR